MMNKEAIQQQAEMIVTKLDAIARDYDAREYGLPTHSDYEVKTMVNAVEHILMESGCATVGEAPQIDILQFVKDYWCLLSTDMDKLDSIELTVTPHQLVAMLKEYAKGRENYGTEASNTDEAVGATLHSSSGNSVEQGENGDSWISVSDSLPEHRNNRYLIYDGLRVVVAVFNFWGFWNSPEIDLISSKVTHWQPLPQPPKSK